MRPKVSPDDREEGSLRVQFQVQFARGPKGRHRLREAIDPAPSPPADPARQAALDDADADNSPLKASTGPHPRITRLLVLGHRIEGMIRSGEIPDLAEAARLIGITRARVTQITNLTLLAPDIQESILEIPQTSTRRDGPNEHHFRSLLAHALWHHQRQAWSKLNGQTHHRLSPGIPS